MLNREKLFGRLATLSYETMVEATRLCRVRKHGVVELEHWLLAMLSRERSDLPCILTYYGASPANALAHVDRVLSRLPVSVSPVHDLAPRLEEAVERGLVASQMLQPGARVRTAHVLAGLLQIPSWQQWLYRVSKEFEAIPLPRFIDELDDILAGSSESVHADAGERPAIADSMHGGEGDAALADDPLLTWCADLTAEARAGRIDPVVGREHELRQVIDIVLRRRQNNPILVGEAGVGKTAVAEAFAQRIAAGDVPPSLLKARLISLDLGRLQAGASARGEFEARLKKLIDTIAAQADPIILFCDEAHTLIGAGGQAGTGDAVNLLKPMLARGELRMIAATTWSEYKQFIEPDAALTRRFQPVLIEEPSEAVAGDMLRSIARKFAAHHTVVIRSDAIDAAVRLSSRHLPARQLPDKAISLLDTACARVAQSQYSRPLELDTHVAALHAYEQRQQALAAEAHFGVCVDAEQAALDTAMENERAAIAELERRLACERELNRQLHDADTGTDAARGVILAELVATQAEQALVFPWVDAQVVARVLADWTGIPLGKMLVDDLDHVLGLEASLGKRVFGQDHAIATLARAVRIARSGLQPPNRPLGIFILAGPTGTGKTEAALALADAVAGGEHNLITLNMSEFQEAHTASTLKGAPPGYVGYGKGGKLTEAVRRKPHSVVLLDEFDKAHRDVHDLFYQVFDKGWMEDGEGRAISFRQCFIVLTTNVGAEAIGHAWEAEPVPSAKALQHIAREALTRVFPVALLARTQIVPFVPLGVSALNGIADKQLAGLGARLITEAGVQLHLRGDVHGWIAERVATQPNSGRAVAELLTEAVLPAVSFELLQRKRHDDVLQAVTLCREDDSLHVEFS